MNSSPSSEEFIKTLLNQDPFLGSEAFAEHRRTVIERLGRAMQEEKRARRVMLAASAACAALFVLMIGATFLWEKSRDPAWPDWLINTLALLGLLAPVAALLVFSVYLVRYRLELLRARRSVRTQTAADLSREIVQLRKELEELKGRLKTGRDPALSKDRSEAGFTLMEMMTVVTVVTILGSLLIPTLSRAQARVKATQCKNNLRQMAQALAIYEGEFRYYPGAGDSAILLSNIPWIARAPDSWVAKLGPYLGGNERVFRCPAYTPPQLNGDGTVVSESFGYNASGSSWAYDTSRTLGLGLGKSNFVSSAVLKAPADMLALGDLQLSPAVALNIISPSRKMAMGGLKFVIPERHFSGANTAFADGHIEWAKRPWWTDESDTARSRWNNDHEPHPETW